MWHTAHKLPTDAEGAFHSEVCFINRAVRMAIIKCKMCGGDIELSADRTFEICEYCGVAMTFPKKKSRGRRAPSSPWRRCWR